MPAISQTLSANVEALRAIQPAFTLPHDTGRAVVVDGILRLAAGARQVALHSRDPHREADGLARSLLDARESASAIVTVGIGAGYLLDALERLGWEGNVLAVEPEPETVRTLLDRRDWRNWIEAGRLRILVAPDFDGASEGWTLLARDGTEPIVWTNPVIARLQPAHVARAAAIADRVRFDAKANADARRLHGAQYLLNTLRNLRTIAREGDAASLEAAAAGMPAIVVGAGPSLDRALPALRAAQDRAVIVTVDTALRPLLAAGVVPHFVVAVDPGESNARHLTALPSCPGTYLVAEASLDRLALAGFQGRTFLFRVSDHQPWPWLRTLGRDVGSLRAWGSVLTTAFDVALRMACDPVVFAGADLAFTGGQLYCRGTVYEEDWRRRSEWGEPVASQWQDAIEQWPPHIEPGVSGDEVRTAAHLVAFRDWLADQIQRDTTRRFVNATGGGILRGSNIEQAALEDVVSQFPQPRIDLRQVARSRYTPAQAVALCEDAEALRMAAARADRAALQLFESWERFAPGLTRERILDALAPSSSDAPAGQAGQATREDGTDVSRHGQVMMADFWLKPWAETVEFVALPMAAERLDRAPGGARIFRFRTMAARLISCSLQPPEGGVTEDGRPLKPAGNLDQVVPGTYSVCRDEIHFMAADGTDPRTNGRRYAVLVAPCVRYLESLPLEEILTRHV